MGLPTAKYFVAEKLGFDANTETGERQIRRIHRELEQAEFALRNNHAAPTGCKVKELHWELRGAVMNF
jgi:hypothetical protein